MEDGRIIDLFFERSEQAVRELEAKYGRGVKALALNILGDVRDAEECAADTYLAVWNSVPPRRPEHLKAYTLAIARNLSLDRYQGIRARKRNSSYDLALSELEDCLASEGDAETELEALELTEPGSEAPKVSDMKTSRHSTKNLRRTLLIAAVISVFFAVTAFAIGYGIDRQRQQELREQLGEKNVVVK